LPDPQFLIDRLDITVVFTIVLTVFKSPGSVDGLKRPQPLGAAGRRSKLQSPRDCSTLAKKICRSAVTSCQSHAAQIVGSLRELTGAV
jgi:hypothetical protein